MNTTSIAVVNGQTIQVSNDEEQLVPIKPICEALGIDRKRQQDKIKEHPILCSVGGLTPLTGADGKQYEMFCLPMRYVYGWLFTINPNNVSEEARPNLIKYQIECYNALYDHFTKQMRRERELLTIENNLLQGRALKEEELTIAKSDVNRLKLEINNIDHDIDKIRAERLNQANPLFD